MQEKSHHHRKSFLKEKAYSWVQGPAGCNDGQRPCSLRSASWYTLTESHWSCGTGCRKIRSPNRFKAGCFKQCRRFLMLPNLTTKCGPPGVDSIRVAKSSCLPRFAVLLFAHLYGAMICAWTLSAVVYHHGAIKKFTLEKMSSCLFFPPKKKTSQKSPWTLKSRVPKWKKKHVKFTIL